MGTSNNLKPEAQARKQAVCQTLPCAKSAPSDTATVTPCRTPASPSHRTEEAACAELSQEAAAQAFDLAAALARQIGNRQSAIENFPSVSGPAPAHNKSPNPLLLSAGAVALPPGFRLRTIAGGWQYRAGDFGSCLYATAEEAVCRAWEHRWHRTGHPLDRAALLDARAHWHRTVLTQEARP